jgi:hypothetical protein
MENWTKAVDEAANIIGEMSLESAEGKQSYTFEDIAAAALKAGVVALLDQGPSQSRVEQAAKVMYEKIHDKNFHEWTSMEELERLFWNDISLAAISASDRRLKKDVENLSCTRKHVD